MKVKATWVSKNPFHPNINTFMYSKTVEVPDGTKMEQLKEFAEQDTQEGYMLKTIEEI